MASRIKGITVEIGGDTTGLDKALKGVNSTIKSTQTQLKDVNKLLKLDPTNTQLLSQKQGILKEKIAATKEKLDALKTAQEQAKAQLESGDLGKDKYDALQREIIETEQELKNLIREAAEANETLNKIDAVGQKFEEVGGKMTAVGKGLTTHVTLPLAALGVAGTKSFADVDKTMQLTNKTMGSTEEEAQMLNKAMKEAAANSTYGMNDAATATLNFARAGLDAQQAADALAPSMNLAAGEGGNLDTVSAGLVATINGFHGSFEEASDYADVFAAACNNSALDVDSLSNAMSVAAPIFSAAGYKVNDAALYMGVMANNGIEADKAANSLKTGLARLVSPAKEGAQKMEELGISVINADGTMKDSVTIQRELHEAFGKLSESEQIAAASAIFGKNQMAPWLALINIAPEDVGKLNKSLEECSGTTEEMAQAMMSGFGGSLERLKSSIDVLMTSVGEALAPTIMKVGEAVQRLVDKFNALTPAQQQTIAKIGLVVAAIGPALVVFGKLTTGIGHGLRAFSSIGKGILTFTGNAKAGIGIAGSLAKGMSVLWSVLMANPIILIVAAIAAAVAALIYGSMTLDEATALEGYFILKGDKFYPLQQGQNCLYPSFSAYETMNVMTVYEDSAYPVPTMEEGDQLVLITSDGFFDEERNIHDVIKTGYTIPIFLEHYSLDDGVLATATDEYYDDISTINGIDYETFLKEHTVDTADYCSISTYPREGMLRGIHNFKGCNPEEALILFDFEDNSDVAVGTYQGTSFQEQHFQSNIKYYMYDGCAEEISTKVGEGVTAGYTFDYTLRGTMCPIEMTQNGYAIIDTSAVPSGLHLINIKDFNIYNNRWPMYPERLYAFEKK